MLTQRKQCFITESQSKLCKDGTKMAKFKPSEQREGIGDTAYQTQAQIINSFMLESLVQNKRKISKDKSNFCNKNIHHTLSLPILEVESILKEEDLIPFWTNCSMEMSKRLPLPLLTDSVDLDLNSSKSYSNGLVQQFQLPKTNNIELLNKNLPKICYLLLQSLRHGTMEQESIQYCRKIKIYPSRRQKKLFAKYFGITRYIYNKCVNYNEKKIGRISRIPLRNNIMGKDSDIDDALKWQTELPFDSRQFVIDNFISNYKSAKTNLKNGNITKFKLSYLTRKQRIQRFYINKNAININLALFKRKNCGNLKITKRNKKKLRKLIKNINHNCTIIKDKDSYYICVPMDKRKRNDDDNREEFVSLDPGVRSFQTFYGEKTYGKIGNVIGADIKKKFLRISKLQSLTDTNNISRQRYRLRQKCSSLITKIKNKINDLHWQTASYLVNNYKTIFIPKFGIQKMLSNTNGLNKRTKRMMQTLANYSFTQKLIHLSKTIKDTKVFVCNESFTTQTCGNCGKLNKKISNKKIFNCKKCKISIDRDVNGSRNILIKQLTKLL